MKLHHFHDVLAIAEQGSIRGAARVLRVDQPALTRSLAELERELGAPLFTRNARGVAATPLGEAFIRRAAAIVQEVRRAREEFEQMRGASRGSVMMGLSIAAHLSLLPSALRSFQQRHPDIALDVMEGYYSTLEGRLRDGRMDFYVGPDPGERLAPDLTRKVLFENERIVIGRVGHPLAAATSLTELVDARWATTLTTVEQVDEIGLTFRRHGLAAPRIALRSHSALTLLTCLSNSDLLALAPVQWSRSVLTRGLLAALNIREALAAPPVVAVLRTDTPLTPAATHMLDLLCRRRPSSLDTGVSQPHFAVPKR